MLLSQPSYLTADERDQEIFAATVRAGRGTGSRGELSAHDLDILSLDSRVVQAEATLFPSM